jgi:hypothetical protein
MRLMIDTSKVTFTVSREANAKMEPNNGGQKRDRNTGFPLWTVQLVAMEAEGAEVINVTVASESEPKLTVGQVVTPVGLQAIPWAQNGKNGTAFRVESFKPVAASKSA